METGGMSVPPVHRRVQMVCPDESSLVCRSQARPWLLIPKYLNFQDWYKKMLKQKGLVCL